MAPVKYPLSCSLLLRGARGHSNSQERKVIQLGRKESLYKLQERKPNSPPTLNLGQGKHSEHGGWGYGGSEGNRWGRGGGSRRENHGGEARGGDADVEVEISQKRERGPEGGRITDTRDAMEETCAGALSGGAGADGGFERLRFQTPPGAGGLGFRGPPRGVGGQVALPGSHLVNLSCCELVHAHERWRVYGR